MTETSHQFYSTHNIYIHLQKCYCLSFAKPQSQIKVQNLRKHSNEYIDTLFAFFLVQEKLIIFLFVYLFLYKYKYIFLLSPLVFLY